MKKLIVFIAVVFLAGFLPAVNMESFAFTNLHEFNGGAGDGQSPHYGSTLTLGGTTLYGVTPNGGASDNGVVFSINTDGTGFRVLHEFTGGAAGGSRPGGRVVLDGSTIYGATYAGGNNGYGVIFKVNTDGTGFTVLHHFNHLTGGASPYGGLTMIGAALYGMNSWGGDCGGASCHGVVYKINTDGTGYTVLHGFDDWGEPYGLPVMGGKKLYGMNYYGGSAVRGVVFEMDTNGGGYRHLHEFTGGIADGAYPMGDVTVVGDVIYGMTKNGGDADAGVIFRMDIDGTNYTHLHEFAGGVADGENPYGSLLYFNSRLYGMTYLGGGGVSGSGGVIFRINLDGSGYTILHQFGLGSTPGDGFRPFGALISDGTKLYGMTNDGTGSNYGVIFSIIDSDSGGGGGSGGGETGGGGGGCFIRQLAE